MLLQLVHRILAGRLPSVLCHFEFLTAHLKSLQYLERAQDHLFGLSPNVLTYVYGMRVDGTGIKIGLEVRK